MDTGSGRVNLLSRLPAQPESLRSRAWDLQPTPKISPLSHRAVSPHETFALVRGCVHRIPISRISNLTPLDRLRLPVYSATTPLALDLTTHMGKGLDAESARLSAIMEAVERVSAEQVDGPTLRGAFRTISRDAPRVMDPRLFDLPDDTAYHDAREIAWIKGWDLAARGGVWLPLDLAITPPQDGVLHDVDTNGLAAGNSLLEAIVHGLCEVIERDAFGLDLFRSRFCDAEDQAGGRRLDPDSLAAMCPEWCERIAGQGLGLETELLESDVGIPVFRTTLTDQAFPSNREGAIRTFVGFGASPNAVIAALRSVTEAVQSRVAAVQGARDSFNTVSAEWRPSIPKLRVRDIDARSRVALDDLPTFSSTDLLEDLHYLLHRLRTAGFAHVVAVNLTRREFGVPVVRIRVTGLTSFAVNRRRVGWRCLRYLL